MLTHTATGGSSVSDDGMSKRHQEVSNLHLKIAQQAFYHAELQYLTVWPASLAEACIKNSPCARPKDHGSTAWAIIIADGGVTMLIETGC